jgi:hypothetical protein
VDTGLDIDDVAWDQVEHAFGPATEVPGWLRGLRAPAHTAECLGGLYGYIAHQGSRYTATAAAIPYLIDAALDPATPDRAGIVYLIQHCAVGFTQDRLDWRYQRDRQADGPERAAWDAVVAGHARLRALLDDPDHAAAAAALMALAWTGDASSPVLDAIRDSVRSPDSPRACDGWLAAVTLGQLPEGVAPPDALAAPGTVARYGQAAAALRFAGLSARPEAVDELCGALDGTAFGAPCAFLTPDYPEQVASWILATTPAHLRAHALTQLLPLIAQGWRKGYHAMDAYLRLTLRDNPAPGSADALPSDARDALTALLEPLDAWQDRGASGRGVPELRQHGLPETQAALATWLSGPS